MADIEELLGGDLFARLLARDKVIPLMFGEDRVCVMCQRETGVVSLFAGELCDVLGCQPDDATTPISPVPLDKVMETAKQHGGPVAHKFARWLQKTIRVHQYAPTDEAIAAGYVAWGLVPTRAKNGGKVLYVTLEPMLTQTGYAWLEKTLPGRPPVQVH